MQKSNSVTLAGLWKSLGYSLRGLRELIRNEPNARVHAVATVLVCAAAAALRVSGRDWCLLVIAMTAVWVAEAMNTAVETLTDLVSPEFHPLAGRSKDLAAGAALIACIGAVMIGGIVFVPYLSLWWFPAGAATGIGPSGDSVLR
jgi:diacylglycerol kinase